MRDNKNGLKSLTYKIYFHFLLIFIWNCCVVDRLTQISLDVFSWCYSFLVNQILSVQVSDWFLVGLPFHFLCLVRCVQSLSPTACRPLDRDPCVSLQFFLFQTTVLCFARFFCPIFSASFWFYFRFQFVLLFFSSKSLVLIKHHLFPGLPDNERCSVRFRTTDGTLTENSYSQLFIFVGIFKLEALQIAAFVHFLLRFWFLLRPLPKSLPHITNRSMNCQAFAFVVLVIFCV